MLIAYPHPTLDGVVIVAAADMPHAVKKQVNATELSGKPKAKRDLHLNGLPIQLRMGFDAYKLSLDYTSEGAITLYPRLGLEVFMKRSKTRMRFGFSARALGKSIAKCIRENKHKLAHKASPSTFNSYLAVCKYTDRFIDIMNAKKEKGCYYVNSPNNPQLFELLNYVKFLCKWRDQSRSYGNKYFYFADSTHQNTLWMTLSLLYVGKRHLPRG